MTGVRASPKSVLKDSGLRWRLVRFPGYKGIGIGKPSRHTTFESEGDPQAAYAAASHGGERPD